MTARSWNKRLWAGIGIAAAVVAILVGAGLLSVADDRPTQNASAAAASASAAVPVTVAPVTARPVERSIHAVGSLYGIAEITVTPKIEGVVTKVLRDVGDEVEQNGVLMEIEDTYYRLAVQEAERALELELAKLGLKNLPESEWNVDVVPMVVRARSDLNEAEQRYRRAKSLYNSKALSQEEMDRAQRDYEVATAARDQAVLEAKTTLAAARYRHATLETARQKLEETKVRAPVLSKEQIEAARAAFAPLVSLPEDISPRFFVAQRLVTEGEMIRAFPSVPAYKLVIDQALKLITSVPERYLAEVKVGQTARLHVEAYPNEIFVGRVSRITPIVDRTSRTLWLEILVPNLDRRLKAGGFADVTIITASQTEALTVPEEALVRFAGVTKVFVVREGKAAPVEVRVQSRVTVDRGQQAENWVEVTGALSAGELVVTTGQTKLVADTPVQVRR